MDKAVGKCNVSMRFLSIIIKLKLAGIIVLIYPGNLYLSEITKLRNIALKDVQS
ncbi:hypothetical protein OUHCRE13_31870 [Enterobacter roggenkampii]|jgi:hypothetical protein